MFLSLILFFLACDTKSDTTDDKRNGCGAQVNNYEKEVLRYTKEMKQKTLSEQQKQDFQKSFDYHKKMLHALEKDGKLTEDCLKKVKALTLQADLSAPINKYDIKVRKTNPE